MHDSALLDSSVWKRPFEKGQSGSSQLATSVIYLVYQLISFNIKSSLQEISKVIYRKWNFACAVGNVFSLLEIASRLSEWVFSDPWAGSWIPESLCEPSVSGGGALLHTCNPCLSGPFVSDFSAGDAV